MTNALQCGAPAAALPAPAAPLGLVASVRPALAAAPARNLRRRRAAGHGVGRRGRGRARVDADGGLPGAVALQSPLAGHHGGLVVNNLGRVPEVAYPYGLKADGNPYTYPDPTMM